MNVIPNEKMETRSRTSDLRTTSQVIGLHRYIFSQLPFLKGGISLFFAKLINKALLPLKREDGRDFWKSLFKRLNCYQKRQSLVSEV
jgi:hypothetical protein